MSSVTVEIRAGTGGDEAALFVADLFEMYSKYAQSQGWKKKVVRASRTDLGGLKEVVFILKNGDVFSKMQYEGGVHRVQRIPKTERSGRIHTSTATVAVLPRMKSTKVKLKPQDLDFDFFRSSGPGGQYVNKRETAVRVTHLPTGITASSQTERNQLKNKQSALKILKAKLLDAKKSKKLSKRSKKRKKQIGRAKRVEKIRTYNFPQDRVTDHRIKKSWHRIDKIMDGNLGKIFKKLHKEL